MSDKRDNFDSSSLESDPAVGTNLGPAWDDFNRYVEAYTSLDRLPRMEYDPLIQDILIVPAEELIATDSETLDIWSYKLECYALYLHTFLAKDQLRMDWCEEIIHYVMTKDYDHTAMIKYELRRQMAIRENTFLHDVNLVRNRLAVRVSTLKSKINHITSLSDKLGRMAQRRKYDG